MSKEPKPPCMRTGIARTVLMGGLAVAIVPAWTGVQTIAASDDLLANVTAATVAYADGATDAGSASTADAGDASAKSGTAKDETVYIKTSASGATTGIYVVNRFAAGSGTVADPANYLSVSNMSTSDPLTLANGVVEVPLQSSMPFYYEGTLPAETAVPWNVSLKYFLDGDEIDPGDLGGATGRLRIELSVTARTSATEKGVSDFANSYVLQAQGTFDSASFEIEDDGSLMIAQVGSESIVNCMVLPGESKTFVMEGAASNFASSGWQISALPLALAISLADQDTSQLTDATSQLTSATEKLANGSDALAQGMSEAVGGTQSLVQGSSILSAGMQVLSEGMLELAESNEALLDGWSQITNGASALAAGADELAQGSETYLSTLESTLESMDGSDTLYNFALRLYNTALQQYISSPTQENKDQLDQMLNMVASASQAVGAQTALSQVINGYDDLKEGIEAVQGGAESLSQGTQEFDGYLQSYTDGVTAANSGVSALASGVEQLIDGASQLSSGANELNDGASALASGSSQLAASVKGIDAELLEGIQAAIDEKLGADFELHSFVAPENTSVESVQFVYMVDGVSASQAQDTPEENVVVEESDSGLIDRIIAWFKGLFS